MKLNISFPKTGCQKTIKIKDEEALLPFYYKRMGSRVPADSLGPEWKGYVFEITGGNDRDGFPMRQGVLTNKRVRLLLSDSQPCYRPRRDGERRRKSVRGCIVDENLSVLALKIIQRGDQDISGLTDRILARRLGPKRASKIRKMYNLKKEDDVRHFVSKRQVQDDEGKMKGFKAPKIQRLITPKVLQRRRRRLAMKIKRRYKRQQELLRYRRLSFIRQLQFSH